MQKIIDGKSTKLTIFLGKDSIEKLEELVFKPLRGGLKKISLKGCEEAYYLYKAPHSTKPDWYEYLDEVIKGLPESQTSPSLVLLLQIKKKFFAVSFGYGKHMIDDQKIVPNFGLKACLNRLPADQIKTVDKRSLEQMALHTKQQAVVPIHVGSFDLEVDRDLIRSIEGHLENSIIGSHLRGADQLSIVTKQPISNLSELCEELQATYRKQDYKKEFSWIDDVKFVRDDAIINSLDEKILKQINDGDFQGIFLGCPEMVDDAKISSFRFQGPRSRSSYSIFPSIEGYCAIRKESNESNKVELNDIKNDRVRAIDDNDPPGTVDHWPLYRCLHAEVHDGKKTYKLIDGNWYEVNRDFLKRVDDSMSQITSYRRPLPEWKIVDDENDYNKKLARHLGGVCMDRELISLLGRSKFEFCDVFSDSNSMFHVKKHTGAGAISHLLYQAFVSGQTFAQHPQARAELGAHDLIKGANMVRKVNPATFKATDYEIVIGIGSTRAGRLDEILSFFSKISLVHKHRVLKTMGYKVSLAQIQITN